MKYNQFSWKVIGDFTMVVFLMGLQGGLTKFPCYLCIGIAETLMRTTIGEYGPKKLHFCWKKQSQWEPLIYPSKILMPPMHIKLGLIKQFVKALDRNSEFEFEFEFISPNKNSRKKQNAK